MENLNFQKIQAMINKNYPGMMMFARDINLPQNLIDKYKAGMIILERGFVDATARVGGMVTNCRYCILSNHMANLGFFEHDTNWQLHVAQHHSLFKVLGVHSYQGKTAIFLLHLPNDETWELYKTVEIDLDQQLLENCIKRFEFKCVQDPIPEVTDEKWLRRCEFPVGMGNSGDFWPIEE